MFHCEILDRTHQTARYHGQKQYRERDASQPLLHFGRVLVHMTADTDEVWMATKLAGGSTWFLPFNKGHNEGAGNPPNPAGHKTAYLWEEVFQPKSLAGIIQHFVLLEGKTTEPLAKKALIFPRYQQLDVVRKLLAHTAANGVGHSYLIQHSAGSGKSNSITWAAYQLIESYPERLDLPGARALEAPLFDSVIVVTAFDPFFTVTTLTEANCNTSLTKRRRFGHLFQNRPFSVRSEISPHPRRHPPSSNATAMRVTAIRIQTGRKRQDMSVRRAEQRCCWALTPRVRGLIRPVPAFGAPADTARGDQSAVSEDFGVRRQNTWGMSGGRDLWT